MNADEIDRREAALYEEKRLLIRQNNQLEERVAANNIRLTAIRVELKALRSQTSVDGMAEKAGEWK